MVQIIPAAKTFGSQLGLNLGGGISQGFAKAVQSKQMSEQMKMENEAAKEMGVDLSKISDPKIRELILSQKLKQSGEEELLNKKQSFEERLFDKQQSAKAEDLKQKNKEKTAPLESALGIVEEMRNIRKKGNLGIGTSWSPFASTQKDASTYEQLGKSLISYASTIPIRNQMEFQTLAEKLYDPNITDAHAEGILDAMERIISGSLQEDIEEEVEPKRKSKKSSKEKPPLTSFFK